jgi:hypothetical protein
MFVNSFYLPQIDQLTLPCFILGMNVGCVRELGWSGLGWPVFGPLSFYSSIGIF